jgi:hypothetical protein
MAKRQILLFELLKEDDKSKNPETLWDRLFRKKMLSESSPETAERISVSHTDVSDVPCTQKISTEDEGGQTLEAQEQSNLYIRINTYTKVLAAVLVLVIFFCGYIFGHSRGWRAGAQERSNLQMAEVQNQPADSEVLKVLAPPVHTTVVAANTPATMGNKEVSKNEGKISRKIGFNYLIIQNFSPEGLETASLAKDFLAEKGIETTVERFERSYQLVSLQGFDMSDPQEKERSILFQKQILALGQKFKQARESRSVDFRGCYYLRWN